MRVSSLLCLAVTASACKPPLIAPEPPIRAVQEHVVVKSYRVGERQRAFVGEPVAKVRDFHVARFPQPIVRASADFEIRAAGTTCTGESGTELPVTGRYSTDSMTYLVFDIRCKHGTRRLFAAPDGTLFHSWIHPSTRNAAPLTLRPDGVRFRPEIRDSSASRPGSVNYELLYSGTDGRALTLNYREYTPDNLARTAFGQSVVFPADAPLIRFRDLRLQVHKADSESIEFTILSDSASVP